VTLLKLRSFFFLFNKGVYDMISPAALLGHVREEERPCLVESCAIFEAFGLQDSIGSSLEEIKIQEHITEEELDSEMRWIEDENLIGFNLFVHVLTDKVSEEAWVFQHQLNDFTVEATRIFTTCAGEQGNTLTLEPPCLTLTLALTLTLTLTLRLSLTLTLTLKELAI